MRSLADLVNTLGGVAATHELLALGVPAIALTAAVRSGTLIRPRQGWYLPPTARDDVVRAVRVGGRLASVSSAATYGLAVPHSFPLHVHIPHCGSRLRTETDPTVRLADSVGATTIIHRGPVAPPTHSTRLRLGLVDTLVQVLTTESEEDAVACLDSALNLGLVAASSLQSGMARLPLRRRGIGRLSDGRSDSYPESIARRRLAVAGIASEPQVCVLGERWIDLLVGDRLALEIDGAGKYTDDMDPHTVARKMHADRDRDAFLEALGYHVIRLSYRMVVFDWLATLAMIQAVMDRGDHLSRR